MFKFQKSFKIILFKKSGGLPFSQPSDVQILDVPVAQLDGAHFRIVESLNQLNAGRLAAAGSSDQSNSLAFADRQVEAHQHLVTYCCYIILL